jgi:hypothetical protein
MKSGLYQKFISKEIDPKIKTEKLPEVNLGTITNKRVNWSDNPIPEGDKVKHPKFNQAMKAINTYTGMKGGKEATDYFIKNIEKPAIKYNSKTYSLQALIPD